MEIFVRKRVRMIELKEKLSYSEFFQRARDVYSWMEDDLSKEIFRAKFEWSGTGANRLGDNYPYYLNISEEKLDQLSGNNLYRLSKIKTEVLIIYGAGVGGKIAYNSIDSNLYKTILYCDKNYDKIKKVCGIPVISPNKLIDKYNDAKILLAVNQGKEDVLRFLEENQISKENIFSPHITLLESQYFEDFIKLSDSEVFCDCGVFDGSTSIMFHERSNQKYKKIHLFEPDPVNIDIIAENFKKTNITNYNLHSFGVWSEKTVLKFISGFGAGSFVDGVNPAKDGFLEGREEIIVPVDSLDNVFLNIQKEDWPTIIKMDIEGSELSALKGASTIISEVKPKLLISIYHKNEDILEIPTFIKKLVPEYKFHLRHYTTGYYETVLYATV